MFLIPHSPKPCYEANKFIQSPRSRRRAFTDIMIHVTKREINFLEGKKFFHFGIFKGDLTRRF